MCYTQNIHVFFYYNMNKYAACTEKSVFPFISLNCYLTNNGATVVRQTRVRLELDNNLAH